MTIVSVLSNSNILSNSSVLINSSVLSNSIILSNISAVILLVLVINLLSFLITSRDLMCVLSRINIIYNLSILSFTVIENTTRILNYLNSIGIYYLNYVYSINISSFNLQRTLTFNPTACQCLLY